MDAAQERGRDAAGEKIAERGWGGFGARAEVERAAGTVGPEGLLHGWRIGEGGEGGVELEGLEEREGEENSEGSRGTQRRE